MLATLLQTLAVDYNYDYSYPTVTPDSAAAGTAFAVLWLLYFAAIIFFVVCLWKIFAKAGKPGWAAIVPIYNVIVWLEIVGRPLWWILLWFIPFVNIIVAIIVANDLSKSFGKDVGYTIGLILLPVIFLPMLAFGKATYLGPKAGGSTPTARAS